MKINFYKLKGILMVLFVFTFFINQKTYSYSQNTATETTDWEEEMSGDIGLLTDSPEFVAATEAAIRAAKGKTFKQVIDKAIRDLNAAKNDVRVILPKKMTAEDERLLYEVLPNSIKGESYIGWGYMTHTLKNGKIVEFYYYEKIK